MREVEKVRVYLTEDEKKLAPASWVRCAESACAPFTWQNFSARKWLESAFVAVGRLREAHAASALGFLLRKGVQILANDWYRQTLITYDQWVATNNSSAYAEWYAPLYATQVAPRVGRGQRFTEGRIIGEDSHLINQKFGIIESFERELFDDDQTGQVRTRSAGLGQSMRVTESFWNIWRFLGITQTYGDLVVPASIYATTNYAGAAVSGPWSSTLYGSALGNRLATYLALNMVGLKNAWSISLIASDPLGNRLIVQPDTLLHSVYDALHAPLLVKPPQGVPYYPAVIGPSGNTANNATSGYPGGAFGANPFIGLGINPVMERYSPDWFWALGQSRRGFVMQNRDPLEIIQETPTSGDAFNFDSIRFRSRRRFESDWVGGGSRFWVLGNAGYWLGSANSVDSSSGVQGSF